MNCPIQSEENTEILLDYCAGKLSPEVALRFESHMVECADCKSFCGAQKTTWDALDVWQPAAVSADFDRKLYARIEEHEQSGWWTRLWKRTLWQPSFSGAAVPVATACAVAVVGVMLYLPINRLAGDHSSAPVLKIEKADIEQLETTLDDIEMFKQLAQDSPAKS